MQSSGPGGSPGGSPAPTRPAESGFYGGGAGHAGCDAGAHHTGGGAAAHAHPGISQSAHMHHPPLHQAYHYGYYPHGSDPQYAAPSTEGYSILGLNLSEGNFWKGALIGAALTLLITNETVQKAIMKGVAKAYSAAQDGVAELKEMFEDAQAELRKPAE